MEMERDCLVLAGPWALRVHLASRDCVASPEILAHADPSDLRESQVLKEIGALMVSQVCKV